MAYTKIEKLKCSLAKRISLWRDEINHRFWLSDLFLCAVYFEHCVRYEVIVYSIWFMFLSPFFFSSFSFLFHFHFSWFIHFHKGASKKISRRTIFLLNRSERCTSKHTLFMSALFYFTSRTVISMLLLARLLACQSAYVCSFLFSVNVVVLNVSLFFHRISISLLLLWNTKQALAKGANEILRLLTHYKVCFRNKITVRKWLENRGIDDFQHLG